MLPRKTLFFFLFLAFGSAPGLPSEEPEIKTEEQAQEESVEAEDKAASDEPEDGVSAGVSVPPLPIQISPLCPLSPELQSWIRQRAEAATGSPAAKFPPFLHRKDLSGIEALEAELSRCLSMRDSVQESLWQEQLSRMLSRLDDARKTIVHARWRAQAAQALCEPLLELQNPRSLDSRHWPPVDICSDCHEALEAWRSMFTTCEDLAHGGFTPPETLEEALASTRASYRAAEEICSSRGILLVLDLEEADRKIAYLSWTPTRRDFEETRSLLGEIRWCG